MQNQFKPGDLALIVGAYRTSENIGKSCLLIEVLDPEKFSQWLRPYNGLPIRNTEIRPGWIVEGDDLVSCFGENGWALVDPKHLMPLKGTETPQLEKQKEVEHG